MTGEAGKRDERISRLIDAQIELTERQNTLTRDVAALGYRVDHAATLQAANAEQIKAIIESRARTDALIKALAEQVRRLLDRIGRPQAGPVAEPDRRREAGEEDARDKRLMNDLGITEIGAGAELPDQLRVKDVARWLGLHQNTIYGLIHKGEIPCKRIGKRTYIFNKATLLEWEKSSSSVPELATRGREAR